MTADRIGEVRPLSQNEEGRNYQEGALTQTYSSQATGPLGLPIGSRNWYYHNGQVYDEKAYTSLMGVAVELLQQNPNRDLSFLGFTNTHRLSEQTHIFYQRALRRWFGGQEIDKYGNHNPFMAELFSPANTGMDGSGIANFMGVMAIVRAVALRSLTAIFRVGMALRAAKGPIYYVPSTDRFLSYAAKVVEPPGMLDVAAHGNPMAIQVGHVAVNHRVFAALIRRNPQFTGQPIRLLSCSTGASPDGFAQHLANALGVPVYAPNNVLWVAPDGVITIGAKSYINSGSFIKFLPGGP